MTNPSNTTSLNHLILVLGMHRSGTSALTGTLQQLGVSLGAPLIEPADDNPKGFFEHAWAVEADESLLECIGSCWDDPSPSPLTDGEVSNRAISEAQGQLQKTVSRQGGWRGPLGAIKDPRLCRLLPLWKPVLREQVRGYSAIFIVRNPADVMASLMRRDGMRADHAALMWLRHYVDAERNSRDMPRALVTYEGLFRNWRYELAHAASALGLEWPHTITDVNDAVEAFLDPSLRHHRDTSLLEELNQPIKGWVETCLHTLEAERSEFFTALKDVGRSIDQWDGQINAFWFFAQDRDQWRRESLKVWNDLHNCLREVDALKGEISSCQNETQLRSQEHQGVVAERDALQRSLQEMLESRSWRITRPMRAVMGQMRRIGAHSRDTVWPGGHGPTPGLAEAGEGVSAVPNAANARPPAPRPDSAGRILLVAPDFVGPIRNGGIGTAFTAMARQLTTAGYEVCVLFTLGEYTEGDLPFSYWREHYAQDGVTLIPLLPGPNEPKLDAPWFCWHAYRVYLWMKRYGEAFDVAYFPEWRGEAYYVLQAKKMGMAFDKLPIGVVTHSPTCWSDDGNYVLPARPDELDLEYMERRVAEMADFVVSPSRYLIDWLGNRGWKLPDNTRVIQNMMPEAVATHTVSGTAATVQELVFFGRLEPRKGLRVFLKALKRLPEEQARQLKITFLGKAICTATFDSEKFIAFELADWPSSYELITGYGRDEALAYLRQPGRVAVIASLVDNSPYTVLECVLGRIPFIASDVGGIAELIREEDCERTLFKPTPAGIHNALKVIAESGFTPAAPSEDPEATRQAWLDLQKEVMGSNLQVEEKRSLPNITVCLTHYDRPGLLDVALQSLRDQTYTNFDVVLIDDGSPSRRAQQRLDELEPEFERRGWRIVRQENAYLSAARNHAAEHAKGEYLMFMDDDNIAKPHELAVFAQCVAYTDADILTTVSDVFDSESDSDWPEKSSHLWIPLGGATSLGVLRNVFGDANALVRRETFEQLGGFSEDYGVGHEDWEFFARACLNGADLQLVPEPLFWYRVRENSMIRTGEASADLARGIRPYQSIMSDGIGHTLAFALQMHSANEWAGKGNWTEAPVERKGRLRLLFLTSTRIFNSRLREKFLFCLRQYGMRFAMRRAFEYVSMRH